MNQEKIGKFISENRKIKKLTQSQLAEKLGVSDRAVSNWENGKNMPDLSLFKPLCDILGITINELMNGDKISNKDYNEKLEENFINTIDYINKKNIKENYIKYISLLLISILVICLTKVLTMDYELQNYLIVICMILSVYSIKQIFMKYRRARRIVAVLLIIVCIISLILK